MEARKIIANTTNYIASEWGVRIEGDKIIAYAHFIPACKDYSIYGDDADCYEEFERDGFIISQECKTYAAAQEWINKNVFC